jgi:type I restriction enzyme S subunit
MCVRTTEFRPGRLDLREVRYVSEETYAERTERLVPQEGDILYSREGGILGIACMVPPGVELCLGQRMMLVRADIDVVPAFIMHVLNSSLTLGRVRDLTGGSASPHLNVRDIKHFPVPLPPLDEQGKAVDTVNHLLYLADIIEARVKRAEARVEQTAQAVLAKAFRGELVPQDPADEPAAATLARVHSAELPGAARTGRHRQ